MLDWNLFTYQYYVEITNFKGPIGLLIDLIEKQKIDLKDIPISEITSQYLEHIEIIKEIDINKASDFIAMASFLLKVKAEYLLYEKQQDKSEELDPRRKIIKKIEEYKLYKEISKKLSKMLNITYFKSDIAKFDPIEIDTEQRYYLNIKDLVEVYLDILKRYKRLLEDQNFYTSKYRIEEEIKKILEIIKKFKEVYFEDIVKEKEGDKEYMITNFMAILELAKLQNIRLSQQKNFDRIKLFLNRYE